MNCQPFPSSGNLQPGICYTFGQAAAAHPASWWTVPHIAALCVVVAWCAVAIAARRRIREVAWAVLHRDDPASVLCPPVRWDGEQWLPDGHQVTIREWFRLPKCERDWRAAEFKAADEALQINSFEEEQAGVDEETGTYHILNGRVNDLWGTVPWWCRQ